MNKTELYILIVETRDKLYQTANSCSGLTDAHLVKTSQYLDSLLNEYQKIELK